jgi:protein-L-isoaspartate(D-aspartate) O-methyltransferase
VEPAAVTLAPRVHRAAAWLRNARAARLVVALLGAGSATVADAQPAGGATDSARRRMVDEIAAMAKDTAGYTGRARFSDRVMQAMYDVPRHAFVPEHLRGSAYENRPLPIGSGQTISQPYIVALSTDLVDPAPGDVVLEIGTGSGYQAAVLSRVVARVHSIEIVESLGREAAKRLRALRFDNVEVRIGDGYQGWPERAPFDAIVVTTAAPRIPEPLVQQLKPNGRMVIPLDARGGGQELLLIVKRADGTIERRVVLPVRFVPMTGPGATGSR